MTTMVGPQVQLLETVGQLLCLEQVPRREGLSRETLQLVHYYGGSIWGRHIIVALRSLSLG